MHFLARPKNQERETYHSTTGSLATRVVVCSLSREPREKYRVEGVLKIRHKIYIKSRFAKRAQHKIYTGK